MTETIRAAAVATRIISDHVAAARTCLTEFSDISRNGAGVLAAPEHQRYDLAAAADELRKALDVFDSTDWPTDRDYHAL